jgi:hypothetical protein
LWPRCHPLFSGASSLINSSLRALLPSQDKRRLQILLERAVTDQEKLDLANQIATRGVYTAKDEDDTFLQPLERTVGGMVPDSSGTNQSRTPSLEDSRGGVRTGRPRKRDEEEEYEQQKNVVAGWVESVPEMSASSSSSAVRPPLKKSGTEPRMLGESQPLSFPLRFRRLMLSPLT